MGDTAAEAIKDLNINDKSKTKAMKEKKKKAEDSGAVKELNPWPEFIQKRITLWDKFKVQYEEELAKKPDLSVVVTLPDGKTVEAKAWKTSPYDVAKGISSGISRSYFCLTCGNERAYKHVANVCVGEGAVSAHIRNVFVRPLHK